MFYTLVTRLKDVEKRKIHIELNGYIYYMDPSVNLK